MGIIDREIERERAEVDDWMWTLRLLCLCLDPMRISVDGAQQLEFSGRGSNKYYLLVFYTQSQRPLSSSSSWSGTPRSSAAGMPARCPSRPFRGRSKLSSAKTLGLPMAFAGIEAPMCPKYTFAPSPPKNSLPQKAPTNRTSPLTSLCVSLRFNLPSSPLLLLLLRRFLCLIVDDREGLDRLYACATPPLLLLWQLSG